MQRPIKGEHAGKIACHRCQNEEEEENEHGPFNEPFEGSKEALAALGVF